MHSGVSERIERSRLRDGITGAFEVPRENDNSRRGLGFCAEKGLCVGKTYSEYRSFHKYTRVQDSRIDQVLVKMDFLLGGLEIKN